MNILIKNADIITVNNNDDVFYNKDLAIKDSVIKYIGEIPSSFKPDKVIDGSNKIVIPGLINAHTHAAMTLFRNYADDLPLWDWLSKKIWPIEDKLNGNDVYWGTMLSIVEMIKSGTTCFSDMYFFMDDIAKAVNETGIRARLSRGLTGEEPKDDLRIKEAKELYDNWNNSCDGRITVMLSPHAPYTCSTKYLKEVVKIAKELNVGIHIHLSESKKEVEDNYKKYGKSPIKYANDIGIFDIPTIAAHCVNISDDDIDILASKGVNVVNNPGSNLKLGNGFAPVDKMIKKGINVALGTDGASSNNNLNMFEEINLAAIVNKGINNDPISITAKEALKMATINGAKALGLENEIGSIEVGKKADLILVDQNKPHFYPKYNIISAMAYSAQGSDVDTVIINGKVIMESRQFKDIDEENIIYNVNKCAKQLINR